VNIKRSAAQPYGKGDARYFTGDVFIDSLVDAPHATGVFGAKVMFEPGARTAWHTHLLGQILIVTSGCGLVQSWGGPVEEIHRGDVVWCPPGEKHWHGATPTTPMTHSAIVELLDGKSTDWMEKVSDEEYLAGPSIQPSAEEVKRIEEAYLPSIGYGLAIRTERRTENAHTKTR
jgi:quercetin dioxygenase-like cupin family protein